MIRVDCSPIWGTPQECSSSSEQLWRTAEADSSNRERPLPGSLGIIDIYEHIVAHSRASSVLQIYSLLIDGCSNLDM